MEDANAPMQPTMAQRRVLALYQRFGTGGVVAVVTLVSVVLSVAVTTVVLAAAGGLTDPSVRIPSFAVAIAVPLLVAPLASYLVVELVAQLERANAHLDRIANTDPLTGVFNRRGFFTTAEALFRADDHRALLVGMVDLDRFKALNDAHGHHRGDQALRLMAERAGAALGADGVLGRFGGDEFAFVMRPSISVAIEDLRHRLVAACGRAEVDGVLVTASIGLCEALGTDTLDTALSRADADLYRSKAASRVDQPRHAAPSWSGDSPVRTRH